MVTEPARPRLPAAVTHFAPHCTAPGDIEAITPQHAPWRTNECAVFASGAINECCAELGIVPVGYHGIQRCGPFGNS